MSFRLPALSACLKNPADEARFKRGFALSDLLRCSFGRKVGRAANQIVDAISAGMTRQNRESNRSNDYNDTHPWAVANGAAEQPLACFLTRWAR